jgi:DNA repair exonuclease SbcCD ATPase subunit
VEADKVMRVIRDSVHSSTPNSSDTMQNLDNLTIVCRDLETMIENITEIVPDVSYFPMYEVRCVELKEALIRQVRHLHSEVLEAIAEENRAHMLAISSKYQEVANTLVAEATDSAELKALQEYTTKAAMVLSDLYDQYVGQCYERVCFLLRYKFKMAKEDIQVLYTTFHWPLNIQSYLRRSYEAQAARKRELEELLEEDQRKLENDMHDIAKRVESLADNPTPMEFRKNVDRISAIKRDLDAKQERAEEISAREVLLEMPQSDFLTRLDETRAQVDPLDRLEFNPSPNPNPNADPNH